LASYSGNEVILGVQWCNLRYIDYRKELGPLTMHDLTNISQVVNYASASKYT
jgi:hypothetical protein